MRVKKTKIRLLVIVFIFIIDSFGYFKYVDHKEAEKSALTEDERLVMEAEKYAKKGEYELSIESFDNAIIINPKNTGTYSRRAYVCFSNDDYDEGIESLEK